MNHVAIVMVAGAVVVAGCAGPMFEGTIFEQPPRRDPEVTRVANSAQQMGADVRQLSVQIDALGRNLEILEGRLSRLETQVGAASNAPDDFAAVRRDIQLIRDERETLKKEITDDLAARVEKIAARQQTEGRASRSAVAAGGNASGASRVTGSASRPSGYEHKVEKGQTLSEIAKGYGTTVDAIMKANKLANPSTLRVGQVLFIPD